MKPEAGLFDGRGRSRREQIGSECLWRRHGEGAAPALEHEPARVEAVVSRPCAHDAAARSMRPMEEAGPGALDHRVGGAAGYRQRMRDRIGGPPGVEAVETRSGAGGSDRPGSRRHVPSLPVLRAERLAEPGRELVAERGRHDRVADRRVAVDRAGRDRAPDHPTGMGHRAEVQVVLIAQVRAERECPGTVERPGRCRPRTTDHAPAEIEQRPASRMSQRRRRRGGRCDAYELIRERNRRASPPPPT